ncbi:MAG: MxaS protein [Methylovulum sp.]|nr:MxaS protein [Methylovulum sp.]
MANRQPETFQYRTRLPGNRVYPGAHAGRMVSSGQLFKRHEPLIAYPDPRRIDLRASVLDMFGQYRVRVYQQHSVIEVMLLADMSASMNSGDTNKLQMFLDCLASIAESAFSYGDSFSFIACGATVEPRYVLMQCKQHGTILSLINRLQTARFAPQHPRWQDTLPYLPTSPSLLFLLSDFHYDLSILKPLLHRLRRHDVVPLVSWQRSEYQDLPEWGLVSFQDSENRSSRALFMRPALRRKIVQSFAQRRRQLQAFFRALGSEPLFLEDSYNAAQLQHYFLTRTA